MQISATLREKRLPCKGLVEVLALVEDEQKLAICSLRWSGGHTFPIISTHFAHVPHELEGLNHPPLPPIMCVVYPLSDAYGLTIPHN